MAKKSNARRADGRIAVQVYIGTVDGKRKYKTVYGNTQKEADEKALQVKLALKKGIDVTADRDTFEVWAKRFIAVKEAAEISLSQLKVYKNNIQHLSPLSNQQISKISAGDIQEIINWLAKPHDTKKSII